VASVFDEDFFLAWPDAALLPDDAFNLADEPLLFVDTAILSFDGEAGSVPILSEDGDGVGVEEEGGGEIGGGRCSDEGERARGNGAAPADGSVANSGGMASGELAAGGGMAEDSIDEELADVRIGVVIEVLIGL